VLSTDYPHPDSNYPFAVEKFLGLSKVSDSTKRKILWDNCARLYNL
jgi:predicted TIM-barrel fold metal-dependent hydrolase